MNINHSKKSLEHLEKNGKDKSYTEWLESISSQRYLMSSRDYFLVFLEFLKTQGFKNPTGDSILKQHNENRKSDDNKTKYQFDDLFPKFVSWLKEERGLSHNSAVNVAVSIRGFFKYHRMPLEVQKGSKTTLIETIKKHHIFTQADLQRMVRVADLEEKAVILLGKDEGIRVGDFVSQKRKPILEAYKDSNGEFPLEFEISTEKEGVVAVCHILQETWEALQDYWANVPNSDYVFPSNGDHMSEDRANDVIKNTWSKAFPDRKETPVRFHELRSFKMTALSDVGVNEWAIKKMIGKKLDRDLSTYLRGQNLKEAFQKASSKLQLTGIRNGNNHEKIDKLIEENISLRQDVDSLKRNMEHQNQKVKELENLLTDYQSELGKTLARLYKMPTGEEERK